MVFLKTRRVTPITVAWMRPTRELCANLSAPPRDAQPAASAHRRVAPRRSRRQAHEPQIAVGLEARPVARLSHEEPGRQDVRPDTRHDALNQGRTRMAE